MSNSYDAVFEDQPRLVNKGWYVWMAASRDISFLIVASRFSLFQVMAAYTGGGLSLVDQ